MHGVHKEFLLMAEDPLCEFLENVESIGFGAERVEDDVHFIVSVLEPAHCGVGGGALKIEWMARRRVAVML